MSKASAEQKELATDVYHLLTTYEDEEWVGGFVLEHMVAFFLNNLLRNKNPHLHFYFEYRGIEIERCCLRPHFGQLLCWYDITLSQEYRTVPVQYEVIMQQRSNRVIS